MPGYTVTDLFTKVGVLTMDLEAIKTENEALRAEVEALQKALAEQDAPKKEAPKEK